MASRLIDGMRKMDNAAYTANGALSNRSTLSDVLDYFGSAPARRGMDNTTNFMKAYYEDKVYALKAAFYIRDVRGGQGERDTFLQALTWLYNNDVATFEKIVELVPVYGRWKDVLTFVDNRVVRAMVKIQLYNDRAMEHPSLLGKWMPSENTSSKATRKLARKWAKALDMTMHDYGDMLVSLRRRIGIVEAYLSAKNYDAIDYSHVPSSAGLRYRKAFFKHDADRYKAFIDSVNAGEKTINAGTLYPYELTTKYTGYHNQHSKDATVEALWKNLPNYADTDRNALVIADVSGSMYSGSIPKIAPIDICISLAVYISERNKGLFKDHFITFSDRPKLQRLSGNSLYDRVQQLNEADWGGSTNLQASLRLILDTAVKNNISVAEMPEVLFIISDMQFNGTVTGMSNLNEMKLRFASAGYALPKIVFWNVNASRGKDQPVVYDDRGVYLVAGASPSIFVAAINTKTLTPMELMLEVLDKPRYAAIAEALA